MRDHLLLCATTDKGATVPEEAARRLFDLLCAVQPVIQVAKTVAPLERETQRRKQLILSELSQKQAQWFDEEIDKLNNWAEDKRRGLKAELKDYDDQIGELKKASRLAANLPEKLAAQKSIRDLDARRNTAWKQYDDAARQIEEQKDVLLDGVEARLKQTIAEKTIFTLAWSIL